MTHVKPIPEGMHTVTPHLVCPQASEAIEFYKKAFNAEELERLSGPDGRLLHAKIKIGDSIIMIADDFPEWGSLSPKALKGSPVTLHIYVNDADKQFAQALEAGASVKMPIDTMFWGDRYGIVEDPSGHFWSIATHIQDLTAEEIQEAAKKACSGEHK
ncbi:MAG: VOC family protein [Pseudomonadota bacterium]